MAKITRLDNLQGRDIYENTALAKINQLIDAVNDQQQQLNNHLCRLMALEKTEEQDPYSEQKKWIGKVCRFWFDNPNDTLLDYLDKIQTGKNGVIEYYSKESGDWFPHCEPVLPTDNAIYKGGDNE